MSAENVMRYTCDRCDAVAETQVELQMRPPFLPEGWAHLSLRTNDFEGERRMPFNWLLCEGCHGALRGVLRNGGVA